MWTLQPAYGRDYKSKAAVEADFNADKDFILAATPYGPEFGNRPINRPQIPNGDQVAIRYSSNRKVHVFKVTK